MNTPVIPDASLPTRVDQAVRQVMDELETLRQEKLQVWRRRWIPGAIVIIGAALLLSEIMSEPALGGHSPVLFLLFCAGIWYWCDWPRRQFRDRFREQVFPRVARVVGNLDYHPHGTWSEKDLAGTGLMPPYNDLSSQDHFTGEYRGVSLHLSEALLEMKGNKSKYTVFDGIFIGMTLPRPVPGKTLVTKDYGALANTLIGFGRWSLDRVTLEDPRFEDKFEVYGTDQVAARRFLTPALMERLMALPEHFRSPSLALSVQDSTLFMTVPHPRGNRKISGLYKLSLRKPLDTAPVLQLAAELKAVLDVIDILKVGEVIR
ncbi:MAG: DUF3137 domain-containing protein [Pseudomonadota bacterium]|nr:DUF3137 domain-containing protein [Pseudomonadota bacterium]